MKTSGSASRTSNDKHLQHNYTIIDRETFEEEERKRAGKATERNGKASIIRSIGHDERVVERVKIIVHACTASFGERIIASRGSARALLHVLALRVDRELVAVRHSRTRRTSLEVGFNVMLVKIQITREKEIPRRDSPTPSYRDEP